MKNLNLILCVVMIISSTALYAQSKGEMPFSSSSPEANKLLRQAWVAYFDVKLDEGNNLVNQVLEKDPDCGMAYLSILTFDIEKRKQNLKKAGEKKLSDEERMFLDGLTASLNKKPTNEFFEPLLKKYPRDRSLHLWIMFNYNDPKRGTEIGEMLIKRNSKFAPAYNVLGYLYMQQNDMKKAEARFNKYVALRPKLANVYDSKGDYMMKAEKFQEAIPLFEKSASMGMKSSEIKAERARGRLKYPKISEKEIEEIKQIKKTFYGAFKNNDLESAMKYTSDQAIEFFPNQMVNVGKANIRHRYNSMFKSNTYTKFDITSQSVDGVGPIAVTWGNYEFAYRSTSSSETTERTGYYVYILRKNDDIGWRNLVFHWLHTGEDVTSLSSEDAASVRKVLGQWNSFTNPGEVMSQKHTDKLADLYSAQAVEIYPNQRSNIGIANLRTRWAQYIGTKFETNSLGTIGVQGIGRRAVAWGIGNQSFYPEGSEELSKFQFPWAMILTKEKDDVWRILAIHWYIE